MNRLVIDASVAIKWVVEDGTFVKRGDKLVDFDDSTVREQLEAEKVRCEEALAARTNAGEDLELVKKDFHVDMRLAEIAVRLDLAVCINVLKVN